MKTPSATRCTRRILVEVVLVLDLADDDLDQILERDEPVGAAIFVDDQRHLRAARLHALQERARRHRGRHEEHRPHQLGAVQRAASGRRCRNRSAAKAARSRPAGSAPCRRTRPSGRGCAPCRSGRRASRGRPACANGRSRGRWRSPRRCVASISSASMSARGTITSSTRMSPSFRMARSMARSSAERVAPAASSAAIASSISARADPFGLMPSALIRAARRRPTNVR